MKTIGRVDLGHSLKQYLELVGQINLTLGEGIVPAITVATLDNSPFSLDLPFVGHVTLGAVAAEYSIVIIRPTGLPVNSWATIDVVRTLTQAAGDLYIDPYDLASAPAVTAGGTVRALRRARIDGGQPGLPEVDFLYGSTVTAPPGLGTLVTESTVSTRETVGPWHITAGGALVISTGVANRTMSVGVRGRVHFTSAK